jgi:hypothetical protein
VLRKAKKVQIASGDSLSAAVFVGQGVPVSIDLPASFTGTEITFQASRDNDTYLDLTDSSGGEVQVTVSASKSVALDAVYLAGAIYLKVRSGTSAVPTAEAGARLLYLNTRAEL